MNRGNLRAWANYRYANRPAFIFGEKHLTFGEMFARSGKVANGLRSIGLHKGQKMAILLGNRIDTLDCQGGIGRSV